VIAGGQENMSAAPHVLLGSRDGFRMGDAKLVDTMIVDGCGTSTTSTTWAPPPRTSRRSTRLSRKEQDEFAVKSQNKAEAAQRPVGFKDEIVPVMIPQRKAIPWHSTPTSSSKRGTTLESVSGLKPAFAKDGSVTAANASGLNDGAAAVLVMSAERAHALGLQADCENQGVRVVRCGSVDHGHGTGALIEESAGESRLEGLRPRSDGDHEAFAAASVCGE
jgi:acetyl-CoA C-acetyltransferase